MATRTKKKPTTAAPKPSTETTPGGVLRIPSSCSKCGSENLSIVEGSEPIIKPIPKTIDGVKYSAIAWLRSKCECGQRVNVIEYLPAKR